MGSHRRRRIRVLCSECQRAIDPPPPPPEKVELHASGTLTSATIDIQAQDAQGLSQALDALVAIGAVTEGAQARLEGAAAVRFWTVEAERLAEVFDVYAQAGVVEDGIAPEPVGAHVMVTGGSEWIGAQVGLEGADMDDVGEAVAEGRDVVRLEDGGWGRLASVDAARSIASGELSRATGAGIKLAHRDVEQLEGVLRGLGRVKMVPGTERLFQALLVGSGGIIPRRIQATLRPYQESGLAWLRFIHDLGSGGILADSMGLGKSLQTICLICSVMEDEGRIRALVVAPTSVVPNWLKEFAKFAPHIRVLRWHGPTRKEKLAPLAAHADVIVTSYGLARNDLDFFNSLGLSYVILDEAQYIKTPSNATSQAMRRFNALHRLAITGTPIENRLSEFWALFDFTSPGLLGTLSQFKQAVAKIGEGDTDAVTRLRNQIGPFLLRRNIREVAKDLPDKMEHDYICPMTDRQSDLYAQFKAEARERSKTAENQGAMLKLITQLRQVACDPRLAGQTSFGEEDSGKLLALRDLLEECIDGGHRVIVFSQYTDMLFLIRQMLEKQKWKYEYLDGQTRDRIGAVDRFQEDASIPVFLISLKAGGTGLNITAADTVIHYDPWWNPAVEDQATARAHRIGQTRTVMVYRLITEGSIEEKVTEMKARKAKLAADVLADPSAVEASVTLDEMRGLLALSLIMRRPFLYPER